MYRRIVLKLSGETLAPLASNGSVFDKDRVDECARMLIKIAAEGVQLAVILGGGNIWRGRFNPDMDPVTADQMGMLATVLIALCCAEAVNRLGGKAKVFTAQEMTRFAELYRADRADEALNDGYIVFAAGGTGNPFFTTDSAAALRACELRCDALLKGTKVDGVYDADPVKHPEAKRYETLTFDKAIADNLKVMDQTAFTLCKENDMPIIVFNMNDEGTLEKVVEGNGRCTVLSNK